MVDADGHRRDDAQLREAGEHLSGDPGVADKQGLGVRSSREDLRRRGRDLVANLEAGRLEQARPAVAIGPDRVEIDRQSHWEGGAAWPTTGASYAPPHAHGKHPALLASREVGWYQSHPVLPMRQQGRERGRRFRAPRARHALALPSLGWTARVLPRAARPARALLVRADRHHHVPGQLGLDARELPPHRRPALPRPDPAAPLPDASSATLGCLVIGFPVAYWISRLSAAPADARCSSP